MKITSEATDKKINRVVGYGLVSIFALFIVKACVNDASKTPEQKRAEACADSVMAYTMAKHFVERRLKAPSTADFGSYTDSHVTGGNCKFTVSGYVDAQNGFGAKLRNYYVANIRLDPEEDGSAHLEYIDIGESPPQAPPMVDATPSAPATPYKPVDPAKFGKNCIDVKTGAHVPCAG